MQSFAEVEPNFIRRHRGQLYDNWKVMQNDTDYHRLKFNGNNNNPLLKLQGWKEFQEFWGFPNNVSIVFRYHGNNVFRVVAFEEIFHYTALPSFHSRSMSPNTDFYDLEVTYLKHHVPKLVSHNI
jgi:hypothetical protein